MHYFTFDSVPSTDYGVYVTASNIFDSAEEDVESVEIPYSNNIVHLSKGSFKPFTIKNECLIYESAFTSVDSFRNFLQSRGKACRYVDSLKTDEFRIARFKRAFEVRKTDYDDIAIFSLEFESRPERFLVSGETPSETSGSSDLTLVNNQSFASKPLIEITGRGTCTVGDYSIIFGGGSGITPGISNNVIIDCETMQCYAIESIQGGGDLIINMNNMIELPDGFPVLKPGENIINKGTTTSVKVTPRWWKL